MKPKNKPAKRGKSRLNELERDEGTIKLQKNIYVVFVECESPGNVGFLARTMGNFGLHNLVLINPCELKIDFIVGSTGAPGGSYNLSRIPIRPDELADKMNYDNKIAILFGREGDGLSNKEVDMCDVIVSIPTDPSYPIMNISHAAAIILYEVFKNRNKFSVEGLEESTALEKEYLIKDMEDLIDTLPIPEHKKRNGLKTFKNIVNRAFITGREAHTLKGILRRLKNKIDEN